MATVTAKGITPPATPHSASEVINGRGVPATNSYRPRNHAGGNQRSPCVEESPRLSPSTTKPRTGSRKSSDSRNSSTAPACARLASLAAARRPKARITSPCADVTPKKTNALAAIDETMCPAMARGIWTNEPAATAGNATDGIAFNATVKPANSRTSPPSRPSIWMPSGIGIGASTYASRRAGESVSQRTTEISPIAPAERSRNTSRSPQNAASTIAG